MARPKKNKASSDTVERETEPPVPSDAGKPALLDDHEAIGTPCRYTDEGGRVHAAVVSGAYSDGRFAVAVHDACERCTRHLGPVAFGEGPGTAQAVS